MEVNCQLYILTDSLSKKEPPEPTEMVLDLVTVWSSYVRQEEEEEVCPLPTSKPWIF